MTAHTKRAHAILSPSGADRWIACPGSALASADAPRTNSKASLDGTRCHELLEAAWAVYSPAAALVGAEMPSGIVTEEDATAVQVVLDVYQAFERDGWGLEIERTTDATMIDIHPECWGTPDAWALKPGIGALVIDAKFGRKPVDAASTQLLIYGMSRALKARVPLTCCIVQPHLPIMEQHHKLHTWPVSTMQMMLGGLRESAMRAMQPNAPRNAGPWCEFCGAKEACPALQSRALTIARSDFSPTGAKVPPAPSELSADQVGLVLSHAATIEAWLDGVRARAYRMAEAGSPPDGWKLVKGRAGNRKWIDPDAAALSLSQMGVPDPYVRELMSPAQAEKVIEKECRDMLKLLTTRSEGKLELVPASDKRAAISGPAIDFKLPS